MRLDRLLAGLDATYVGCGPDLELRALRSDSRRVEPGDAFVATRGDTVDGHDFIASARDQGAAIVLCDAARGGLSGAPRVELASPHAALGQLAANAFGRPGDELQLCGLTGTNGKTTVAHLVSAILATAGQPKHLRLGTTGNLVGDTEVSATFTTPFPVELHGLLRSARDGGADFGVMEVSSHALAQGRVDALEFAVCGLTSFSQDHLDYHATMADYLAAKCRLPAQHLRDGGVVLHHPGEAGDAFARAAAPGARIWAIDPESERAAIHVEPGSLHLREGVHANVVTPGGRLELRSPMVGLHNLDNLLLAIGVGVALDLPVDAIAEALARSHGAPGRLQRVEAPADSLPEVYVDYAHTPDAVARVVEALRPRCRGLLWVVLGCGGDRDRSKRPQMAAAALRGDRLVATSDNPRTEAPDAILDDMLQELAGDPRVVRLVDRRAAIEQTLRSAATDDVVLIAGKGHEDYQIVGRQRLPFDDREVAARVLAELTGDPPS